MLIDRCDDRSLYDTRPLILCGLRTYKGPLVNQIIEADRWRQVIDTTELRPSGLPALPPTVPIVANEAPETCRAACAAPPPDVVRHVVREPIYHLGTLLDVLA